MGTSAAPAAAHHAAAASAADQAGTEHARLLSAIERATEHTAHKPASALPASYTVRAGDSLSAIAGRFYHNTAAWPVLYWANHGQVRWANDIQTGQVLKVPVEPTRIPSAPALLGPPAPAAPSNTAPAQAAPAQAAPVQEAASTVTSTYSGGAADGSFGQCVVAHESGGNAQVMNGSGHYGLYQFSASTWSAYGGSAADFGHASVAEQNQVFANAIAAGGQSNWAPYDGC